jgi:hypothetical protein
MRKVLIVDAAHIYLSNPFQCFYPPNHLYYLLLWKTLAVPIIAVLASPAGTGSWARPALAAALAP